MPFVLLSQDVAQLDNLVDFDHSGHISAGTRFYQVNGINPRSNSNWLISGRYAVTLGGFTFPASFSFSKAGTTSSFRHPFNRFGMSPYYKWIKLHLGHRNINFSPYTLAGKTINGAGIELTPGKFRFTALYGKMRNYQIDQIRIDEPVIVNLQERKVAAAKLGFGSTKNFVELIAFKALDVNDPDLINTAKENLVLGSKFQMTFFDRIVLQANVAGSGYTNDAGARSINVSDNFEVINKWLPFKTSTRFNTAGDAKISYRAANFNIGAEYRRVDLLFRSLGTYYLPSDLEQVNVFTDFSIRKGLLSVRLNGGVERNNLDNNRSTSRERLIVSGNLMFKPSKSISGNISMSNFQRSAEPTLSNILDTFRLVSTSRQFNVNLNWKLLENASINQSIAAYFSRSTINDESDGISTLGRDVTNINSSLSYRLLLKSTALSISPRIYFSQFNLQNSNNRRYGLSLSVRKSFFQKKFHLNVAPTFAYSDIGVARNGTIFRTNFQVQYSLARSQRLSLRMSYLKRSLVTRPSFDETRAHLSYSTSF